MEGMVEKIWDDLGSSFSIYQNLYFFLIGQLSIIFLPGSINMVVIIISVDQHIWWNYLIIERTSEVSISG